MNISEKYYNSILKVHPNLNKYILEKDLILSYLLQDLSKYEGLIFKGGTYLSKSYLNYHRISEDLDFNLQISEYNSKTKRNSELRKYFKEFFLPFLQNIANKYNLDFDKNEFETKNERYCPVKRADNVYIFNVYNDKESNNPIKIEINISEKLFYSMQVNKIINLTKNQNFLTYPLNNFNINTYSIEEIILEKIRAILTRKEGIHERDIFDLFLINKKHNIFDLNKDYLDKKIKDSFLYDINLISKRLKELKEYKLFEEIHNLTLIEFDKQEYSNFFIKLKNFIYELNLKNSS